jgi:hypothetical protein
MFYAAPPDWVFCNPGTQMIAESAIATLARNWALTLRSQHIAIDKAEQQDPTDDPLLVEMRCRTRL